MYCCQLQQFNKDLKVGNAFHFYLQQVSSNIFNEMFKNIEQQTFYIQECHKWLPNRCVLVLVELIKPGHDWTHHRAISFWVSTIDASDHWPASFWLLLFLSLLHGKSKWPPEVVVTEEIWPFSTELKEFSRKWIQRAILMTCFYLTIFLATNDMRLSVPSSEWGLISKSTKIIFYEGSTRLTSGCRQHKKEGNVTPKSFLWTI